VSAQTVEYFAQQCEFFLGVEARAFVAGDLEVAAECADRAEGFAVAAFHLAVNL